MLNAIRTNKLSQLLILNQKNERVIVNVPPREWVILEIEDISQVINREIIIADGGQSYVGRWNNQPPFDKEGKAFYLRSNGLDGFSITRSAESFEIIKSISPLAALEAQRDSQDDINRLGSFDSIAQKNDSILLANSFQQKLVSNSNRITFLYSQFRLGRITAIEFFQGVDRINLGFFDELIGDVYNYYDKVIGYDIKYFGEIEGLGQVQGSDRLGYFAPSIDSNIGRNR